jgi:xanthine dehydrogenase small subunit
VDAEDALVGHALTTAHMEEVARIAMRAVEPIDDHRASARYRRAMVGALLRKLAHEHGADTGPSQRDAEVTR